MNSFNFIARGIEAEIERQIGVWESGGEVVQQTFDYDASTADTAHAAAREGGGGRLPLLPRARPRPGRAAGRARRARARRGAGAAGRADPPARAGARLRPRRRARHERPRPALRAHAGRPARRRATSLMNELAGAGVDPDAVDGDELGQADRGAREPPARGLRRGDRQERRRQGSARSRTSREARGQRRRRARAADRSHPRGEPRPGRGVPRRQGGPARLLRRPGDEGDAGQGRPAGRERAAAREADGLGRPGADAAEPLDGRAEDEAGRGIGHRRKASRRDRGRRAPGAAGARRAALLDPRAPVDDQVLLQPGRLHDRSLDRHDDARVALARSAASAAGAGARRRSRRRRGRPRRTRPAATVGVQRDEVSERVGLEQLARARRKVHVSVATPEARPQRPAASRAPSSCAGGRSPSAASAVIRVPRSRAYRDRDVGEGAPGPKCVGPDAFRSVHRFVAPRVRSRGPRSRSGGRCADRRASGRAARARCLRRHDRRGEGAADRPGGAHRPEAREDLRRRRCRAADAEGARGARPARARDALARAGMHGWDVASLQFRLALHGFPSGTFDGDFGPRTDAAVRRYQRWAGLRPDGEVGPATTISLARAAVASPVSIASPIPVPSTDGFGPRGARMHTGSTTRRRAGTPVVAARTGVVTVARWLDGLRQHRRDPAQARREHALRAPLGDPRPSGRTRRGRSADRACRRDRVGHRPAPPLRATRARSGDRSAPGVQMRPQDLAVFGQG